MEIENLRLDFPPTFCCNCGDTNCTLEPQDTRVTRHFFIAGAETTFILDIPLCDACRKTTRRRPQSWLARLLIWAVTAVVAFGGLFALGESVSLPIWMAENLFTLGAGLALVL